MAFCFAMTAPPALAVVDLGMPNNVDVNFDGNGVFDQAVPAGQPVVDGLGPLPLPVGTELFGTGTISDLALADNLGVMLWLPTDEGPNFEMTFVFWDAVVTSSQRYWAGTPGASPATLTATYADGARILLVADTTKDFTDAAGPSAFDLQDGEFPTAYTLEDAGYNSDGLPDATSMFTYADDPGESVFLDLSLASCTSSLTWDPTIGFFPGFFRSTDVTILGGDGASQFLDLFSGDQAWAFIMKIGTPDIAPWLYGGDVDIQLRSIPEPSTLIFLGTGLASLLGYGIRRRMA
jgi:hypothetical protein